MKRNKSDKDRGLDKHKKKKKHKKKRCSSSTSNDSDSDNLKSERNEACKTNSDEKKKIKKHKKKRYSSSSSSDSNSEGEEEWVEAPIPTSKSSEKKSNTQKANVHTSSAAEIIEQREEWMNEESFVPTLSKNEMLLGSSRQKKLEAQKQNRENEEKIQKERELNPYMKNDGKGLPVEEPNAENLSLPSTSVGDGGYSWLKKAYYRILEQSQKEGRSMEEVAVERWGSLDKLLSMIDDAEARMKSNSNSGYKEHKWRDKFDWRKESRNSEKYIKPVNDAFEYRNSKERSFKFQKPSHDVKHKKSFHHFSSKDTAKRGKVFTENTIQSKDSSRSLSPEMLVSKNTCDNGNEKRLSSSGTYDRVPVWKKPKAVCKLDEKVDNKFLDSDMDRHNEDSYKKCEKPTEVKESVSKGDTKMIVQTHEDLSKLASKCIKAELMGNAALAKKLQAELDEARKLVQDSHAEDKHTKQEEEIILTKLDSSGQTQPIQVNHDDRSSSYSRHKSGKSSKYFDDDSKYSLKQMFEREKLTTTDDNVEMFLDVASECNEVTDMDYEKVDIKKISQKMSHSRQEEKDIGKAIRQHQRRNAALEKCEYCLDQPNMKRYLLVDIVEQVYLCLPNYQSVIENHCLIVPKQHVSSFLHLDEDEWREVEDLKKCLRNMFKIQHKSVIFLETSMNFRYCPHAVLECIPVPEESGDMAPFYFKKAIQESETEWAHNQKLVDLKNKGLRRSVPRNLPYFFVEFDPDIHAGFAHVIEEEKYFPRTFGKEIIGGMLDIDYNHLNKNRKEDPLKKSKEVLKFEQMWSKFKTENV